MKTVKDIYHHFREMYYEQLRNDLRLVLKPTHSPKVDFLGCGAQKSGTTALDRYLRQHQAICLPERKEIHYFDIEYNFRFPKMDYSKYHSFFNIEPHHKIAGEVTPLYMYWYSAPRRIWEYNPEMKLIIILRNPIKRAYSHWNMQRERGYETLSFLDAIAEEETRRRESLPYQNRRFSYLDRGFYTDQIKRLRTYFPANQVLLIKSEILREDPKQILDQIANFLDIPINDNFSKLDVHSRNYESPLDQETHKVLLDLYLYEIKEIEKLTSWDCRDWLVQEA